MILLLGGTSETGPLARVLRQRGREVLVSTATDAPLELPEGVRRRWGRLDAEGLVGLCRQEGIRVLVDAGHPFAVELHASVREAADLTGLPLLRYGRAATPVDAPWVHWAADHESAARLACSFGKTILLTTGSRHLTPYVQAAEAAEVQLFARVLDHPESLRSCEAAGLHPSRILALRGPFDLTTHLAHLHQTGAGVLVSKDSGEAGGVGLKLEASRQAAAELVLVRRPPESGESLDLGTLLQRLDCVGRS
nr:precorrin-6A reductase [uncultured Holophaga sp.]